MPTVISMPPPALAGVGHIAFCHDVRSERFANMSGPYVHMCVCHIRNQVQVKVQIYVHISLAANNFYTFWARKLKLCMTLIHIKTF